MTDENWTAVDSYISQLLVAQDALLDATLKSSIDAGLPAINVSPPQGKLLMLLAKLNCARSILEIGTLGGYSTIWLARALPADGHLITLELSAEHAKVAQGNFAKAGLSDLIELRLGPALETLPKLVSDGAGPFDLIFIDADKPSNPEYFAWALKLAHVGTLIIVDNVVRNGHLSDATSQDPRVQGSRRLHELIAAEPRVSATTIQTVGSKGYDGFTMAIVTSA